MLGRFFGVDDDYLFSFFEYPEVWRDGKLRVVLSGYGREDVKVFIDGNVLKVETLDGKKRMVYSLPSRADPESVGAEMRHGVLTVSIGEKEVTREIVVK